jgi:phosphoribosyl-AMP cyclohydrolase
MTDSRDTPIRIDPGTAFAAPGDGPAQDSAAVFRPRFSRDGLVTAVAVDATDGTVLMVAHMNAEALAATLETGEAHYYSRSRGRLWRKGETSGQVQRIVEVLTDCDQDAIVLRVTVGGDGNSCHTGARSCFYRRVERPAPGETAAAPLPLVRRDAALG